MRGTVIDAAPGAGEQKRGRLIHAVFGARRHLRPLQMSRRCSKPTMSTLADELRCYPASRWPSRSRSCRSGPLPWRSTWPTSLNGWPKFGWGLPGHPSRHNHQYRSSSFGEPHDYRIPCDERYDHGTRYRHRREVVCCRALRLCWHGYGALAQSESGAGDRFHRAFAPLSRTS